ncbi:MAG: sigma-70 family RNA polymerase sigma factor [Candidatus Omnitrophica bacterium]|nr:sigma-70 family RNA polymerase sigma factor [Candidatus Omnitrophota bacterium]
MKGDGTLDKSDLDLVIEAREGKEAAYSELVRRHMEKAVQLASIAVGNYEDAKDVSQEAFVKAYHGLKKFEMKSKFSTWFYRILMNTAQDFVRKRNWKRFLIWKEESKMEEFFERRESAVASPKVRVLQKELGEHIARAIKNLPFKQQWVFTLRFMEGFSIQEISESVQVSEGTVKATLHFAIQKFKKEILPYLQEEQGGVHHGI